MVDQILKGFAGMNDILPPHPGTGVVVQPLHITSAFAKPQVRKAVKGRVQRQQMIRCNHIAQNQIAVQVEQMVLQS